MNSTSAMGAFAASLLLLAPIGEARAESGEESKAMFRHSQYLLPDVFEFAPGTITEPISERSLQLPLLLRNYLWYEGSEDFIQDVANTHLESMFDYFRPFENEAGLLTGMGEAWTLDEWPESLQTGYDYAAARSGAGALLNAFYYKSLVTAGALMDDLGRNGSFLTRKGALLRAAFRRELIDPSTGLVRDAKESQQPSLQANAVAICFGLLADDEITPEVIALIREGRLKCPPEFAPYVIEALFIVGETSLAYELLQELGITSWSKLTRLADGDCAASWKDPERWELRWCSPWNNSPVYLLGQYVMGLSPTAPGWGSASVAPRLPDGLVDATLRIPVPTGHITARFEQRTGLKVTLPPTLTTAVAVGEGRAITVNQSISHEYAVLSDEANALLDGAGWPLEVGAEMGVWVSVKEQTLRVIESGEIRYQAKCATAENGTGSELDSLKTPLGWHSIAKMIGDDETWGQVFRSRIPTKEVWKPGDDVKEDLVLTRLLHLTGEEPGKNRGGQIDSYDRAIYIHGTNDEANIGTPTSHGCVRLLNDEVIEVFDILSEGVMVLITED